MIDSSKFSRVEVEWEDHHSTPPNEPQEIAEVEASLRPEHRLSIGWLIAESDRMMAISPLLEEDNTICDVTYIIKDCVVTTRYI